jgi:hypothetical protein
MCAQKGLRGAPSHDCSALTKTNLTKMSLSQRFVAVRLAPWVWTAAQP